MLPPLRSPLRTLLLALLLGFAADSLFFGRWPGVSAPLFFALGLAALGWLAVREDRLPAGIALATGATVLFFAAMIAVRDAPVLVLFNLMAIVGLLLLLVANFRGTVGRGLGEWLLRLLEAGVMVGVLPVTLIGQALRGLPLRHVRFGKALPVVRGLALAVPALLCFGGLLVAADSVFASYVGQLLSLHVPVGHDALFGHSIVVVIAAWMCAGGLVTALTRAVPALPAEGETQRLHAERAAWRPLGTTEALTVLVSVDLLFGAFVLVQATYLFGGLDTLDRTGMTFADYARRGFFELVAVACLALLLLLALAALTGRAGKQARRFNAACIVMVALVLTMLASAFQRMWLYESAYGFTELRLYTHTFMVWLAVILALFVVALLRDRLSLFVRCALYAALLYLALLNVANPEALIVQANVARYAQTGKIDADYLATLSADAAPTIAASLNTLDPATRQTLHDTLDWRADQIRTALAAQGWPAWTWARAQAMSAAGN